MPHSMAQHFYRQHGVTRNLPAKSNTLIDSTAQHFYRQHGVTRWETARRDTLADGAACHTARRDTLVAKTCNKIASGTTRRRSQLGVTR
ncbi:hypothetical protein J6590_030369 [Homalodisca vitripennis]|nr:hypothetical protein J6590_030369 [Homalodisca vitripennis]